jgi:hypothetical protein
MNAMGTMNAGIKLPSEVSFRGTWTGQYLSACTLHHMGGVASWIDFLDRCQEEVDLKFLSWDMIYALAAFEGSMVSSWMIPCIQKTTTGTSIVFETVFVSCEEYMQRNDITDAELFIKDIIDIALYGIPFREDTLGAAGLNLKDPAAYAASRLFQGAAELMIFPGAMTPGFSTVFVSNSLVQLLSSQDQDSFDNEMKDMTASTYRYIETEESTKKQKLEADLEMHARKVLTSTHWMLGNNEDILLELDAKFTFSGMDAMYMEYMKRKKVGSTLGYGLWEALITGKPRVEKRNEADGEQVTDLWWNKVISATV